MYIYQKIPNTYEWRVITQIYNGTSDRGGENKDPELAGRASWQSTEIQSIKNTWVISKLPETKAPEASVLQYSRKIRHRKQNRRILGYGIAASLILLLSFQIFHQFNDYRQEIHFLENQQLAQLEYHTNKGVKGRVTLPDGSIVWLNSDSELKCPAQFSGDSREINFSGEGYFDVVKIPKTDDR